MRFPASSIHVMRHTFHITCQHWGNTPRNIFCAGLASCPVLIRGAGFQLPAAEVSGDERGAGDAYRTVWSVLMGSPCGCDCSNDFGRVKRFRAHCFVNEECAQADSRFQGYNKSRFGQNLNLRAVHTLWSTWGQELLSS